MIRYFEIRAPRADFAGEVAEVRFFNGRTRVSFEDDPEANAAPSTILAANQMRAGRALVRYARGTAGYVVVELDDEGQPIAEGHPAATEADRRVSAPAKAPKIELMRKFQAAQAVREQAAVTTAQAELADAKTVLAALQERPDWDRQPGELDQAMALIQELQGRYEEANNLATTARAKARQAAYAPAIDAANEHAVRLAAAAPRLIGRLAELAAGLAQLIADTEEHREQVRLLTGQRRAVLDAALRYGEQAFLPTGRVARIPDVPRGDMLAAPLLELRQALKRHPL